jgi:pyruvate,water dikinase
MSSEKLIFWFEELGKEHNDVVGKKCANLGEMTRMGFAVPPGFAIAIAMYRKFLHETGAGEELSHYAEGLDELKDKGIAVFEEISRILQGIIEGTETPPAIEGEISRYYDELCKKTGIPDVAVSVRSAGTESRPGMFETYLNVRGRQEVLDKVKKVWASAYTTRAIAFRVNKGLPVLGDELGVAVPKMVNTRASGIGFTVNPVTGDSSKVIIEANWGLGEGVVSGAESVDHFVVDKASLKVTERNVGRKTRCVVNKDKGAGWEDVPIHMQTVSCLNEEEAVEIAKLARSLEERLGCAQDVEWAVDQDLPFPRNIFHLQTRPAKVQARKPKSSTEQIADLIAKSFRTFR